MLTPCFSFLISSPSTLAIKPMLSLKGIIFGKDWAKLENLKEGEDYKLPIVENKYGAIIISLAKQGKPDLSGYDDKSVVWKLDKEYHAGLVLVNEEYNEMIELSDNYIKRFYNDFFATHPIQDKVTS